MKIPKHVAIILDGNGRWAKKRGMPRNYGHTMGAKNVEVICKAAHDLGIEYVTMYAFSTENWNRVIGDTSRLDDKFQQQIAVLERESAHNTGLNLQIAINYGARDEMIRGMKKMWQDGISAEEITEEKYASYLDTKDIPDPDLMIRTSGEQRLSNFLLWQFAYSELYFTEVPWPDFTPEELRKAVEDYSGRDRRYGKIEEE